MGFVSSQVDDTVFLIENEVRGHRTRARPATEIPKSVLRRSRCGDFQGSAESESMFSEDVSTVEEMQGL